MKKSPTSAFTAPNLVVRYRPLLPLTILLLFYYPLIRAVSPGGRPVAVGLSGVYTIGGTSPDYATFAAAVTDLSVQGVGGPVVFQVRNGTYTEQITLPPISGAGPSSTIVFESESGDSTGVVLTFASTDFAAPWTLRLNEADYVTFKSMTIEATGAIYAQALSLVGNARHNRFLNNILRSPIATDNSFNKIVAYCGAGDYEGLVFEKNRFENGSTGLFLSGNTFIIPTRGAANPTYSADLRVDQNTFVDQYYQGIYVEYVSRVKIRANTLASASSLNGYTGLKLVQAIDSTEITANRLFDLPAHGLGMILQNITAPGNAPALVANNFIVVNGNMSQQGLWCSGSNHVQFLFNTIRVLDNNQYGAFFIEWSDSVAVRNNIFSNEDGGFAFYKNGPGAVSSDYNNLYSTGMPLAFWDNLTADDLVSWQTISSGLDTNSLSVAPQFAGPAQYRPHAIELNGSGVPAPPVSTDLEGQTRNAISPDIGADEFTPDPLDAALTTFLSPLPPAPAGLNPVRVVLKNNGSNTITSATLYLKVNAGSPTSTAWSGSLSSGDTAWVTLGAVMLMAGVVYDLTAWVAMPNGMADSYSGNDTTQVLDLLPALSGVYTIGGVAPSFPTFGAAVGSLMQAGVSGPVTFNVRNGSYFEQLTLGEYPGADSTRRVVFQSEMGDSSLVVLTFTSFDFSMPWTLRLSGADFCTFRKMTIAAGGAFAAQAVHLTGNAHYNYFFNNILRSTPGASTSHTRAVVFCLGGINRNAVFRKNVFEFGSTGLWFIGSFNNGDYVPGIVADSNRFFNQFERGLYMNYVDGARIRANLVTSMSPFPAYNGLHVLDGKGAMVITANRVQEAPPNAVGIMLNHVVADPGAPTLLANNFVQITGSAPAIGIGCNSSLHLRILYNTVSNLNTSTGSAALSLQSSDSIALFNNILAGSGGGYALDRGNVLTLTSDHNNLFSTGAVLAKFDAAVLADLDAWRAATTQDSSAVSVDPQFTGPGISRPHAIELNGAALPIPLVPTDIDGAPRDPMHPDIGADEFVPDSLDAALTGFIGLAAPVPAGQTPVRVRLLNNGLDTLSSVQLYLQINNGTPQLTNWTGALASGDTASVTLDTIDLTGAQSYELLAWSALPNGMADVFPANDTAALPELWPALSGVYTIGGVSPDFASFTAAATALQQGGVSGPVEFHARAGVYDEQIILLPAPGADSTHQVVFQSEAGDSTSVTLRYNANAAANFTVLLDGADWITFRKMTIEALNGVYNRVVALNNGAHHNTFSNNILRGVSNTSVSSDRALVYGEDGSANHSLRLIDNRLLHGAYGLYYFGAYLDQITDTWIAGNRFEGQYAGGIYMYYHKNPAVERNRFTPGAYYFSYVGISVNEAYQSPRITANRIVGNSDGHGIAVSGFEGTAPNPAVIANNYIQIGSGASVSHGIQSPNGTHLAILYNTIRMGGTHTNSSALWLGNLGDKDVLNNILVNTGGGYALRLDAPPYDSLLRVDYNNLYSSGSYLVLAGAAVANLTDWKNTGYGFDEHSLGVDPLFYGLDDFRVGESALNGAGTPSAAATTDIESQPRNAQFPDVGADEFPLAPTDAGIGLVVAPQAPFPVGMQAMQAVLKNHGSTALTAVNIAWTVNGVAQTSVAWTGNLASGASQTVALGSIDFAIGPLVSVKVWTSNPNGMADAVAVNDTARVDNLHPGLGGVYTIGGATPDFATFTAAATALKNGGVVDAVTFQVRDGLYTEQIALTSILGADAARTIRFESESGDSTAVTLQYGSTTSTLNYVVLFSGADWFRFSRMTLKALGTTYARVLSFQGGSDNNIVENNRLTGVSTSSTSDSRAVVYSPFGSRDEGNTFRNNHFLQGSEGMYYYGSSVPGEYETGTAVQDNIFENQYQRAVNLVFQVAPLVEGNRVASNTPNTSYNGISLSNCSDALRITANQLTLDKATLGISVDNGFGTAASRGLVANNFVQVNGALAASGISFTNSNYQNAYFNSVHINNSHTGSRAFNLSGGAHLRLFNNIGYNSTGGYALQRNSTTNIAASDRNDWYTTGGNLVHNANFSTFYATLTDWQTATGFDTGSFSIDPQFAGATDLHTANVQLDGEALPFAEAPTDFDGQLRNTTTPDIGADEFATVPNDAGILSVDYPKKIFPAGNQPVQVSLFNNGVDTLATVMVQWTVNGVPQPPYHWAGVLLSGNELDSLHIGNFIFEVDTTYAIDAWTTMPNGQSDGEPANDTARVSNLHAGLSGIYTIGGTNPDFPGFSAALQALEAGGVTGAVVFNVRNGTYAEQLTTGPIAGAGAANTITFQSESGDSSAVILTHGSSSPGANYTLYLNGADWFRFKKLHLRATNAVYGRVLLIQNGALNNAFENNLFSTAPAASSELAYSGDSNDNNTEFRRNRFQYGYSGLYLSGASGQSNESGTVIQDNVFENHAQYGIFLQRQSGALISGNTIQLTNGDGILLYACTNACIVERNKITLHSGSGIHLSDCDNTLGNEGLVASNFIAVGNQQNAYATGINVNASDRNRFYHNSVHITSTYTLARAFYATGASNSLMLRNNILVNSGTGYAIEVQSGPNLSSDYNDLLSSGAVLGQWFGSNAADLAAWQSLSTQDAHSLSIDPLFVSDTDLHVAEVDLDKAGAAVTGATTDIDGEPRNAQTPDIGADEFLPFLLHDIGVIEVYQPRKSTPFAAGLQPILAVIKNSGADTVTSATIRWWVNNSQKTPFAWTGALQPGGRDTVLLGNFDFPIGFGHDFLLYTENPDGQTDPNPENDSLLLTELYAGLNGVYTIGGVLPDFSSFTQAANSLNKGGVLGPVTFNVRNGIYNERVALNVIPGSGPVNTVLFQSESGDSSAVTLKSGVGEYVVLLNGTDYVTFRQLTLESTDVSTYSDVIELRNNATHNTFSNNRIKGVSANGALIRGDAYFSQDDYTTIKNNDFQLAFYGIVFSGSNSAMLETGMLIENNRFENVGRAIFLTYAGSPELRKNRITVTGDAVLLEYCEAAQVLQNKISTVDGVGISLSGCTGTTGNRNLVANNFVHVAGTNPRAGISTYSGDYQNIYHNSVHVNNTNTNSTAFYHYYGSNKFILNNIFANSAGGYATYVQYASGLAQTDFNNLYHTGSYIGYWDGANLANLAALQGAGGKESNSLATSPLFLSATDLHILQAQLDSAATPVPEVTVDIDGTARDANYPDIGADEINFLAKDVGITALIAPLNSCTLGAAETVTVRIQNYSSSNQTGFNVAYSVDGATPVVENIGALSILPGNTADYSFVVKANLSAVSSYSIRAYTALPDDAEPANDTLSAAVNHVQTPAPVSAMIPADGAGGLSTTITFSWSPSAGATLYDLYLWAEGDSQPGTPTAANINQISYTYNNAGNLLQYGESYHWRVTAKNASCSTGGPIQTFTLSTLPDLIVDDITTPAGAFSGQQITLSWEVKNMSGGGTGMGQWMDVVYLSTDATLEYNVDIYLGGFPNFSALGAGQSYSNSKTFTLPQGLNGTYYVFVIADRFGYLLESNDANNVRISDATVNIQLTPPPDLQVTAIVPPNNPFSGESATASWTVTNLGTGETRGAGWTDRVYLSTDSTTLVLANATYLGQRSFSGTLDVNDTYNESLTATLPQGISGTYFIYVVTDFYSQEYEHASEGNNITRSTAFTVFLTPPPDLQVTSVTAPAGGSNRESVTLSYIVSNEGGNTAAGNWIDRIYGSTNPTLVNFNDAVILAAVARPYNLNPTDTYARDVPITVPDGVTGAYYFYVWTDAGNAVYEYTFENNNTRRATAATTIVSPDLAVQNIAAPATAFSGDTLTVSWTDQNVGAGKLVNRSWTDRIYISQNSVFNTATATQVGALAASGSLNAATGLARNAQAVLPQGVSGAHYWFVWADAGAEIYENGSEANNVNTTGVAFDISLSPYPDLHPTAISAPAAAAAGAVVSVTYTVENSGTGAAQPPWKDKIYLSASATWNPNAIQLLRTENIVSAAAKDSSYSRTVQVTLPINMISGVYYLFIVTDQENNLYEYTLEDNNRLASGGINVTGYPPVDLAITDFAAPASVSSGTSVALNWTVGNLAAVSTIAPLWSDDLYWSTDSVWHPNTDLLLGSRQQNGPLPAGASYVATRSVSIPNGISGTYYLLLVNDPGNLHNDLNRANNRMAKAVSVQLTPPPDLAPVDFAAPAQGFAGQPVEVIFTIENMGTGSTAPVSNWTDRVFLSTDFTLDPNDPTLLSAAHTGVLGVAAEYTDTVQVFLPSNSAGNRILILKTDVNNSVYEYTAENNNTAAVSILVVQPPPSDLLVTQVSVPANAVAGEEVMIQWTLKNEGANPAAGYMKEAVYFSLDSLWDVSDALLGVKDAYINLAPQATLSHGFMADLTGVEIGQYYAIVRTDILNNITESGEDNNTTASVNAMQVTVNQLHLGVWTPDQLDDNRNLYYRIEIPDTLAGESLLVTLKGDSIQGANELYLRLGQAPTRAAYDYAYGTPLFGNQEIVVPALQAGTYYLLVYGSTSMGDQQNIALLADILNFEIRRVTANKGGNTGSVTVKIEGAKFEEGMEILLDSAGVILTGTEVLFINSTALFVTFNLHAGVYLENWITAGMPTGFYDVVARKQNGQEARLADGFEVVAGSEPVLNVSLNYPSDARFGVIVTMTLDFNNPGNVDIRVPKLSVISLFEAPIGRTPQELNLNLSDLSVELLEPGGPPNVLRPGGNGTITIYSRATGRMRYKLVELED